MPLAEVAQLVEHGTENAGVDSSILSLGTIVYQTSIFEAKPLNQSLSKPCFAEILPTLVLETSFIRHKIKPPAATPGSVDGLLLSLVAQGVTRLVRIQN